MGKLSPLPSPEIKDGKMERFSFCTASSLIWGEGGGGVEGFAVPFHSLQDCSDRGAFRACGSVIHVFHILIFPLLLSVLPKMILLTTLSTKRNLWSR